MIPQDREELQIHAGEYVLGVLDADAAQEIEAALATNADLRGAVAFWEGRLAGLADAADPADPPADGWDRIAARLDTARAGATANRVWNSVALWRGATAAAAALAAGLLLFIAIQPAAPSLVAVLRAPHGDEIAWVATAGEGGLKLRPVRREAAPQQRTFQVWAIAPGAARPRSLGLMGADDQFALARMPRDLLEGGTLAISLEPAGGSPTGQPTGPVVFAGTLVGAG